MSDIRKREFTQAEKPVRMTRPFDVEVVAKIERKRYALALNLVHDGAIIDAVDRNQLAAAFVEEPPPLFLYLSDIDSADAEKPFRDEEIVTRLLPVRIDFRKEDRKS